MGPTAPWALSLPSPRQRRAGQNLPPPPRRTDPALPQPPGRNAAAGAGQATTLRSSAAAPHGRQPGRSAGSLATTLLSLLLVLLCCLAGPVAPVAASLENDRFDGNIYALYAGNGSLVPPRSSLAQALEAHRVTAVVYYLDDSSASKRFAAVVSELQRVWGTTIELIPLVTDPLLPAGGKGDRAARAKLPVGDPSRYWSGLIPQVVVFDRQGTVVFDASGQVPVDAINAALSQATDLPLPPASAAGGLQSFNELNSEVVSATR